MRIVLDTNIWISGLLLPKSLAGTVIKKWQEAHLTVVTSKPLLNEIAQVLAYPKIFKRLQWDKNTIERYIEYLHFFTEVVPISHINVKVPTDPADSIILATLLASNANYLVTGDQDLLALKTTYSVMTLTDFHKTITG